MCCGISAMSKQAIRDELLLRRRSQDAGERLQYSLRAQERLLASAEFCLARSVALYSPARGEVFTDLLMDEALRLGKHLLFPRMRDRQLELVEIESREELLPGPFGILEPSGGPPVAIGEVGLLVVPGVAFDRTGHRIGYGKGFYDRLLHGADHACKAGIAFDFQLLTELPAEGHDVRMDLLATESVLLRWSDDGSPHRDNTRRIGN
jgi:5-formyltetrahydrofolate cyclo-ligase